ncbi:AER280Cp [Eremothecium gossypii ATCC 10895]|uniref:AER280Cp n=1 Tax=Eremothecium gossypii (strain ATCC 10895 / CBS 109.51 / FGSC 9923 / NRRL Y-1056) TaxID=284811 RepID=Q756I1_EREGS|nr:AER280Cp [Eremothecium gossypii ATCC 10895]AAS52961.1 AER280Cp [Eremothecium gossypii ATCC 10895]AEY97269.1 FAER280Cp [Eremothecium gossypii FDAG1]
MEASSLQIYWHESQPIYSISFQPSLPGSSGAPRLVTAGGDNKARVWQLNFDSERPGKVDSIDFLSSLTQHEQAVNVARFNPSGDVLATAGDDGLLLLWKKNDTIVKEFGIDDDEFADFKESWCVVEKLRTVSTIGTSEIYDLAWSPCAKYIVTGCMDNGVRIFDIAEKTCVAHVVEHNHYVQGVVWDPQNEYIISQSADRSVHIYKIETSTEGHITGLKLHHKIMKGDLPRREEHDPRFLVRSEAKSAYLFHNETLPSFFRRLTTSPCGSILCVPTGVFKANSEGECTNQELSNAVYIYTRSSLKLRNSTPIVALPFLRKPALVVRFSPILYKIETGVEPWIQLPYKLVFAVATSTEVVIYDTVTTKPIAVVGNLHYTPLTDLSWSDSGHLLVVSSTDGFCSYISMEDSLFGEPYSSEAQRTDSLIPSTPKSNIFRNTLRSNPVNVKRKHSVGGHNDSPIKRAAKKVSPLSPVVVDEGSAPAPQPPTPSKDLKPRRRIQPVLVNDNNGGT